MIPPIHSSHSGVLPSAAVVTPSSRHSDNIIDLYAVQRCWYSSPHVTPTVDYLRLLRTPQDAEQIAYHSAHLWAAQSNQNAVVRTITLPAHPSFHAFVAAGQVFWIRRVRAMVAGQNNNATTWDHAHCILSHGILGGGSHGSVRRREVDTAAEPMRIFVGPQSAHRALQLIAAGNAAVPPGSTVQWVPVGAPPTVHHIPNEWPASPTKTTDDMVLPDAHDMAPSDKRTLEENDMNNTVWYSSSSHRSARPKNTDPFVTWQAPPSTSWESRPHKRPCRVTEAVPSSPPHSHAMME